ncbi:MAG: hypothetical protein QX191_07620 [Methylococcaceae bacterium]
MKAWLEPDTAIYEYRYQLFTWWDSLAQDERTEALIKAMVKSGIDIEGLIIKNDFVSNLRFN